MVFHRNINRVTAYISLRTSGKLLKYQDWRGDADKADLLAISSPPGPPSGCFGLVKWEQPRLGVVKLNLAGIKTDTERGFAVGGVLRNDLGSCIVALGMAISADSMDEATVVVLVELLEICKLKDLQAVEIESTSRLREGSFSMEALEDLGFSFQIAKWHIGLCSFHSPIVQPSW